ncbi:MAG: riboflavin biosynthesis protein RibF [Fimbriimonadaceae bacterium]|nr:riboflavin biosynthesis protein RibF [Fimbriimonadaceae bacterium]
MLVHFGVETLQAEWKESVTCVGVFDGVHLGHRAVIGQAIKQARKRECPSIVVTFDRHPAAILAPERCPPQIASIQDDLNQMESIGVAVAVVLQFDLALSETSAQAFLDSILRQTLRASQLVIGHDFALGHNREGTAEWLSNHISTTVVPPFELDGHRVSSSEIRRLVSAGNVERAAVLLGRPFAVEGVVVGGQKLGRTLGYPTLNLARSSAQVMPANGIYAGRCRTRFGVFNAAVSIGVRPAVGGGPRTIEAHLLDYPGDSLYGYGVSLELVARIRDERSFPNLDGLKGQIDQDVVQIREHLR